MVCEANYFRNRVITFRMYIRPDTARVWGKRLSSRGQRNDQKYDTTTSGPVLFEYAALYKLIIIPYLPTGNTSALFSGCFLLFRKNLSSISLHTDINDIVYTWVLSPTPPFYASMSVIQSDSRSTEIHWQLLMSHKPPQFLRESAMEWS